MDQESKNMTIGDLARLMQGEFVGVNKRLDVLETDVKEIKTDLAEVKTEVREMKSNSSELFTKLDRFITLYEKQELENRSLANQIARLEERVNKLEAK